MGKKKHPVIASIYFDNNSLAGYLAKGEFTAEEMAEAIRAEFDPEFIFGDCNSITVRYFGWVPAPTSPFPLMLCLREPGRGAFKGTYVSFD